MTVCDSNSRTTEESTNNYRGDPIISLRLPGEHIDLLDEIADEQDRSRSDLIREGVAGLIEEGPQ